ncbi:MAG: tetratricopeptide repeat protein [Pseudomonadota bacterium]
MPQCCRKVLALSAALIALTLATAPAGAVDPIKVADPYYGQALFNFYKGEFFDSIIDLTSASARDRLPNHAQDAELLLGGLYLSYGLHDEAADIFDRLLATRTDPAVRNRTWFFLAKIRYQRGFHAEALRALESIEGRLEPELRAEQRMMHAQVLMELERYDEAARLLEGWRGPSEWYHFASYNLGVAYVRAGNVEAGARILEELGRRGGVDVAEFRALQDRANVALGYAYLQNEQPDDAKEVLQRVRLEGPYSNKALLGVGWADAENGNYRRALVPWLELRGRDLLDSAVQESLLAIPFAYGQLGANNEAAQQYLLAIEAYVDETVRLDAAIDRIESGEIIAELLAADIDSNAGWFWQLDQVPNSYESRYLYHLLASHEFQEALKNFRDLGQLRENLNVWRENVRVFEDMLDTRQLAFVARLPKAVATLEDNDLADIQARADDLKSRIGTIVASDNVAAMAPDSETRLWDEINDYGETPGLDGPWPEAADARDKLRLLRGVLQWEMEKRFPARVWQVEKDLRDVNRALEVSRDLSAKVEYALANEPQRFADFKTRIDGIQPRLDALSNALDALLVKQQQVVNRIAVGELEARKRRLDTYTIQARFALASIYDRASGGGTD